MSQYQMRRLSNQMQPPEIPSENNLSEVRYEDQEYTSLTSNITNITSLRHSQETSQVDFRMNANPQIESGINGAFIAPTDIIVASTPTKTKPPTATDSSESGFEEGIPDKSKKTSTSDNFISGSKFFDRFKTPQSQTYSSTSDYFTDFTGTDTPSKLRESTRRLSVRKPFNPYIAYSSDEELDVWMKNPKTDYTYSASLTYRKRVTPERKVGSPNMSRKGLRGNIDYNQSSDFSDHSFSIDASSYGKTYQNYRSSGLPMDALSDSESESPPVATRTRNSRSASIDHRNNSNGSIITTVTKSNYTTTKKTFLQGGLDEQSEGDEEVGPLPSLRFRTGTPLTSSRGGTPLIASRAGTPLARRSCTPLFTSHNNETNTRHTNTLTSTPEEVDEKSLYRKIGSIPSAACRTVVLSSKWVFSYIVTSVILMATKTTAYLSSSKNSSTASADKLAKISESNSSHISSCTKSESAFGRFFTTVTTVITTITTTSTTEEITESTSGSLESVTTKVKRRPRLLFWIPLLLLLLLLGTSRGLSNAAVTSHNWIWSSWLGIIGSVGETLSDVSGYTFSTIKSVSSGSLGFLETFWEFTSWVFLSMWSLLAYLCTGFWSGLVYLLTSLWAFLTSFAFTVGEFASGTATALTNTIGLISLPTIGYLKTSPVNEVPSPVVFPSSDHKTAAHQVPLESMVEDIVNKVLGSSRLQDKLQQLINTHKKEEDVSALVRSVIEQEVNLVRAEATVLKKEVESISRDSVQILGLKEQQTSLVKQLNLLAAAVENTSDSTDKQQQFNDQLNGLRDQINFLSQQLRNLQESHINLESEVSSCCKKASLTLEDVERHVTTLLGDILGFSTSDNTTAESGEAPSLATASDLNAWLKSYFVAKHELEARLSALADSMEKATPINVDLPKETMEQTTQMVMETVMNKIRDEIRIQQENFSSQANNLLTDQLEVHVQEQLEENVKVQVEAAAGKLKEQILLDFQEHVKVSTKEMGSSLNAEVNLLVAESVSRELSAAVPLAVSSAIPDAVASQVEGVVEKVVASQVNGVIEKVVASQVDGVIEKVVSSQVDGVIEKAVASQVDRDLEKVITSQFEGVMEKVVASQVNGVVENAVASQVDGVVEKIVASQVNGVVEKVVADQVNGVIENVVASQVDIAVENAVTSQVNKVVENVIGEAVQSSVQTLVSAEISSALAESVSAAVDDKISSTLPEVVAGSLPGMVNVAVTSTVNETVIKAATVAVAAAVGSLPLFNMNEKSKETFEGDVGINQRGKMTANITLSHSNGGNSSSGVLTASGLNEKDVQRIVKEALNMYDADKTGMVDHALESAGGNIISTRCTEGYQVHMAEVSILGWPIYRYSINNPRTIIQPDVMPGQCWAFKGSQGYIVIQLAGPVRPTGFSMEHIPKTLSPSGSIDSAPREFSVWGLVSENGEEIELGSYEFVHDGESLQYFSVKEGTIPNDMYFPIVELKIKSNHGNMKYTCLYRFRVHGVRYF